RVGERHPPRPVDYKVLWVSKRRCAVRRGKQRYDTLVRPNRADNAPAIGRVFTADEDRAGDTRDGAAGIKLHRVGVWERRGAVLAHWRTTWANPVNLPGIRVSAARAGIIPADIEDARGVKGEPDRVGDKGVDADREPRKRGQTWQWRGRRRPGDCSRLRING